MAGLPLELTYCFYREEGFGSVDTDCPLEDLVAFDDLIYIRPSTCSDPTGCVITYAHELQHVVQHSQFPKLMKINSVLRKNLKTWDSKAGEIDLRAERDANLVSRRIAGIVCGETAVSEFAKEQLRLMEKAGAAEQVSRWKYFLDGSCCDLKRETLALLLKHKEKLSGLGIDIDRAELLDD